MRSRVLLVLGFLLCTSPLFAQSEFTVFLNDARFKTTSFTDVDLTRVDLKFDGKVGYGIGYNRYITPNVSTDFSAQVLKADAKAAISDPLFGGATFDLGDLDLRQYDAALNYHFAQRGAIDPYAGGGIAYVTGKLKIPADPAEGIPADELKFDNKFTWLADAGINIRVSPKTAVNLSAKYTAYSTDVDAEPGDGIQKLDFNPLSFNLGIRWRF